MQTIDLDDLQLTEDHYLLDLGCGQGRHALAAYWFGAAQQVVAVDMKWDDLRTAQARQSDFPQTDNNKRCHWVRADGLNLPFKPHSFDVILCSEVLEHVADYAGMLREIHRLLKPGGRLAISVPRSWPEHLCWWLSREYHQVEGGHIRIFNGRQLRREIENLGYMSIRRYWAHALHVPYWWLRCLFWQRGDSFAPVRLYHRLLVWDLMQKPWLTRALERSLNPVMGKSLVMIFEKPLQSPKTHTTIKGTLS